MSPLLAFSTSKIKLRHDQRAASSETDENSGVRLDAAPGPRRANASESIRAFAELAGLADLQQPDPVVCDPGVLGACAEPYRRLEGAVGAEGRRAPMDSDQGVNAELGADPE